MVSPDRECRVDLDIALQGCIEHFEQEFVALWRLEGEGPPEGVTDEEWWELQRLYDLARRLSVASANLFRSSGISSNELATPQYLEEQGRRERERIDELMGRIQDLFSDEEWDELKFKVRRSIKGEDAFRQRFFQTAVQIESAQTFLPSVWRTADRQLELLQFLTEAGNPVIREYLRRVVRCYVWDLKPEFAVMCRAVLEAAFRERRPEGYVQKVLEVPSNQRITLTMWIQEAVASGLLDEESQGAAENVKRFGDAAAHGHSIEEWEKSDVMADLTQVVGILVQ